MLPKQVVGDSEAFHNAIFLLKVQNMSKKSVMVWAWVDIEIREIVEKLAGLKGVSISEYVRSLVLADLDKRSIFTTRMKKEVIPQR